MAASSRCSCARPDRTTGRSPWSRTPDVRENDPKDSDADFKPKETAAAMSVRANTFLDDVLLPLFALDDEEDEQNIAIVSHGLFLAALWRALLLRFKPSTVSLLPDAVDSGTRRPLEYLGSWSNTGYLDIIVKIAPGPAKEEIGDQCEMSKVFNPLAQATMKIHGVNKKEHLTNLKRMRGGMGSSASDDKQRKLEGFFKRPKTQ